MINFHWLTTAVTVGLSVLMALMSQRALVQTEFLLHINRVCPTSQFQCAHGDCVDLGSDCNGTIECPDGSDESDELCKEMETSKTSRNPGGTDAGITDEGSSKKPTPTCILPQFPDNGRYAVSGFPNAAPGQSFEHLFLNVTCDEGFYIAGHESYTLCLQGMWSGPLPQCVRYCKLNKHPSVIYKCQNPGNEIRDFQECREIEPTGTLVRPECRAPNYYNPGTFSNMRCIDGTWDYIAVCTPECGRVTPVGEDLIGGVPAKRIELPWHAGIYRKLETPYQQICGGSLVTDTIVISVAHCFWSDVEKLLPAANYAVAVGKIFRPWNNPQDVDAQKSDIKTIVVPKRFAGSRANYQSDIAILKLVTSIQVTPIVRPVCIDFDYRFDQKQLQEGRFGKIGGWGLTGENGGASKVLKVVTVPYIDIEKCINESPPSFREYITSDKICGGSGKQTGTPLCRGDSGEGLAFPEVDRGIERFYLRGVLSVRPQNEKLCDLDAYNFFTHIIPHEHFIKENLV